MTAKIDSQTLSIIYTFGKLVVHRF